MERMISSGSTKTAKIGQHLTYKADARARTGAGLGCGRSLFPTEALCEPGEERRDLSEGYYNIKEDSLLVYSPPRMLEP